MSRARLDEKTVEKVLVRSRRRCCMCYGLHRDTSIKQGQIAHLDRDSSNPKYDNLAFLCLEHHDQFDSKTSQSKWFVPEEVKKYRDELYSYVWQTFTEPDPVDEMVRNMCGHYIREGLRDSAEFKVRHIERDTFYVEGTALWGTDRDFGPNIGHLEFEGNAGDYELRFCDSYRGADFEAILRFGDESLVVEERGFNARGGMNVTFEGEYAKAS